MKRHTTRKRNRRLKRIANAAKLFDVLEQALGNLLRYKMLSQKSCLEKLLTIEPTDMKSDKLFIDFTISTDKSEISPTAEYKGVE